LRIGLFGGSFNPVHRIHVNIIKRVLSKKLVDDVWIIPCKDHAFDKSLAPFDDRIKMLRLAFKGMPVKISSIESRLKGKSYTSLTVKRLKQLYPHHEFFFICGADIISDFGKWHDQDYITKNLRFIIFGRPRNPDPGGVAHSCPLNIVAAIRNNNPLSSTNIRERIRKGIAVHKYLNMEVEDYIKRKALYR